MNECIICKHYLDNQFCSSCPLDNKNKGMQGIIKFESIIDEKMTNGQVIKTMFPNVKVDINNIYPEIFKINADWWNASYKGGEQE